MVDSEPITYLTPEPYDLVVMGGAILPRFVSRPLSFYFVAISPWSELCKVVVRVAMLGHANRGQVIIERSTPEEEQSRGRR